MPGMTTQTVISLNEDWLYCYATNPGKKYSPPQTKMNWIPLPHLADWAVASSIQTGVDWFRRKIDVAFTDHPVKYLITFENVPDSVTLFINGNYVTNLLRNRKANIDVTEHIRSGENIITMKVTSDSNEGGGVFGNISLQPIDLTSSVR